MVTKCTARPDSSAIVKFADDTTVVGLVTDKNDETAYREEVKDLTVLCKDNNLYLNVIKTKEMIVDYRKRRTEHAPFLIDRAVVEQVEFLGVHITNKLIWYKHIETVKKRVQRNLLPLRRLNTFGMGPQILKRFYNCTIESILTGCITAWYGNCSASDCKALQRVVQTAQYITGAKLPSIQDLYTRRCQRRALKIDSSHPSHRLFSLLPHGKRSSAKSRSKRLLNIFYPQAIILLNI
jgi:hypothetical protein